MYTDGLKNPTHIFVVVLYQIINRLQIFSFQAYHTSICLQKKSILDLPEVIEHAMRTVKQKYNYS